VAAGVLLLSVTQKKLPLVRMFELSIFGAGGALIFSASMSTLSLTIIGIFILGICGGAVYVVGFTLLHENVDDELRGRIFSALYTIVRLCLLIAFALGPFLSELLDTVSGRLFTNRTITIFGRDLFVPGERLTLWLAGVIILIAGMVVYWSLRAGAREAQRI
jgi:dTMP kinase